MTEQPETGPTTSNTLNILLVEDQEADVQLILRALTKGGIANPIHVVRDGQEALDYFSGEGQFADRNRFPIPGLILLDLKLPKVNGLQVLEQLKQTEELKRIPVIVLTSSSESKDVNRAYDVGANSYLVKPVQFSAFCEVVTQIKLYWLLLNEPPNVGPLQ
ncbi:MAG: response regulator [Planctomycetales bacterium]|nr:response regulator [Planctomycetales bacterium]